MHQQRANFRMRYAPLVTTFAAVSLACGEPAGRRGLETPLGPTRSSESICDTNHDIAVRFALLIDGCSAATDGYGDETATFQYEYTPSFKTQDGDQHVLATYELRYAGPGSFGVRLADVVFVDSIIEGDSVTQTNPFSLRYITELAGSKFVGLVGGCSAAYSNPLDCWNNRVPEGPHLEPRFCVDDPSDGAYSDAEALCGDNLDSPIGHNQLPTATFTASEVSKTTTSATWRFNASASSDPEAQALTYHWTFSDGQTASTSDPIYERVFSTEATYSARLRVVDPGEGMDIQVKSFNVTLADPDPLSVTILGPSEAPPNEVCTWMASVEGGLTPYSYEWRRGKSVVGTEELYTANTGTSSFTLSVTVASADGQTASDSHSVTVQESEAFCPTMG